MLTAITMEERINQEKQLTIGIITAVPGERGMILDGMKNIICSDSGKRSYYRGSLDGINTVITASRIGKVAAAITTTHLILNEHVDIIIFIGVAGALDAELNVGDVVIAQKLIQHDMDARPFCPLYTIPILNITQIESDPLLNCLGFQATQIFLKKRLQDALSMSVLQEFAIHEPKVVQGLVLSGDQVIADKNKRKDIKEKLPEALCVEMEGASVAQVCYEYGIPFIVIRTISDYANQSHVSIDIRKFVNAVSGIYSVEIIKEIYRLIREVVQQNSGTLPQSEGILQQAERCSNPLTHQPKHF